MPSPTWELTAYRLWRRGADWWYIAALLAAEGWDVTWREVERVVLDRAGRQMNDYFDRNRRREGDDA